MNEKELLLNKINEKKAQLASSRKGTKAGVLVVQKNQEFLKYLNCQYNR